MSGATIRLAREDDVEQLIALRREFTFEDLEQSTHTARPSYERDCRSFLIDAIESRRWQIWLAEEDGRIVSHAYVALIDKVPRPVIESGRIAYLTNVYTRPEYRGRGIGAQVIRAAQKATREAGAELLIVWPSDESVDLYEREGFAPPADALIWKAESTS